jgi:peptidoglycan/xylan/chitin deacetylase (PgdA/CDA1 family)
MTEKVGARPGSTSRLAGGARKPLIRAAIVSSRAVAPLLLHALGDVRPAVVARVSGDPEVLREAAAGLPEGAATPEAVAARLRLAGTELAWGEPELPGDGSAHLRLCRLRGESSVEIARTDPGLLPYLQLGSYFAVSAKSRLLRRLLLAAPRPPRAPLQAAADAAFWRGVRGAATPREWERLTRSSYVVLLYHRIAGDGKRGQERFDVSPTVFEQHVRWLKRLGVRPLTVDELVAFHHDPETTLPRRAVVLCADDGFRDALVAFRRNIDLRPVLFVTTAAVGGNAPWEWADGEALASWAELREFTEAGGEVSSHARTHVVLPELDRDELAFELTESLRELREQVPRATPLLAYPHGRNSEAVRVAAAAAGYRAAFSTTPGRNGAGTDPYRLRRVEPKSWDGRTAFVWKALTGELVPWQIERWRLRVRCRG